MASKKDKVPTRGDVYQHEHPVPQMTHCDRCNAYVSIMAVYPTIHPDPLVLGVLEICEVCLKAEMDAANQAYLDSCKDTK